MRRNTKATANSGFHGCAWATSSEDERDATGFQSPGIPTGPPMGVAPPKNGLGDEYGQGLAALGVAQLADCFEFDLTYSFACQVEALSDFFQ